jgi:hypothetical protein
LRSASLALCLRADANMHRTLFVLATLTLVGCAEDLTGIHAADRTGTLLDPPAPREDPLAAQREACGEALADGGSLARLPYVQSVSARSAHVVWTSAEAGETLALWTPGGTERTVTPGTAITSYLAGAQQLDAALEGLEPGTMHCYDIRDAAGERVFGPRGFRTAPLPGGDDRVDIAVFGDSGSGTPDQRAVIAQLGTVPIDFVLHVGDVAYPTGTIERYEIVFFDMYAELLPSIPFFTAIGDHDHEADEAAPYLEVFRLPDEGAPTERYYSFDWGDVHVVVLDANGRDPLQTDWLDHDLGATAQPWKIVVAPVPLYSSGFHGSYEEFRSLFEPIFQRHGVQLVLSGDDHDYERTVPIGGVTYVVTGGGGRSVRTVGESEWTALSVTAFHFVYLSVEGDVMRLHAIDAIGREFDGVEIQRGN